MRMKRESKKLDTEAMMDWHEAWVEAWYNSVNSNLQNIGEHGKEASLPP
jgi:hypothetical protein